MLFFFILIIIQLTRIHFTNSIKCSSLKNCSECTIKNSCIWDDNTCRSIEINDYKVKYDKCEYDPISASLIINHCQVQRDSVGAMHYIIRQVDDEYSYKNLYCKWNYNIDSNDTTISINFTRNIKEAMNDTYVIKYIYNDSIEVYLMSQDNQITKKDLSRIEFIYISINGPYDDFPFDFSIYSIKKNNDDGLISDNEGNKKKGPCFLLSSLVHYLEES